MYGGGAPSWVHKVRKEKAEGVLAKILKATKPSDKDLESYGLSEDEIQYVKGFA
ncbi:MAG: hypothetical protein M1504_00645 [Candidatus Marsarchaeota archaeon]|nr:hypothetical protein [Candidatus Marsarchaeota archaeon]